MKIAITLKETNAKCARIVNNTHENIQNTKNNVTQCVFPVAFEFIFRCAVYKFRFRNIVA